MMRKGLRFALGLSLVLGGAGSSLLAQPISFRRLAGPPGRAGWFDGPVAEAQFAEPNGVAIDSHGNIFVADSSNHRIRRISTSGVVSTLAGSGVAGSGDGQGASASFRYPRGVAVVGDAVFVADSGNHSIRRVSPSGVVTTLAGGGPGFADGAGSEARFRWPSGLAVDGAGNLFVADSSNHAVRKVTPAGLVTTVAGNGTAGADDGVGAAATFYSPMGLTVDAEGWIYVADTMNCRVRKVGPEGQVRTVAGRGWDYQDGYVAWAEFGGPTGITLDESGAIVVSDSGNRCLRRISRDGWVTSLTVSGWMARSSVSQSLVTLASPAGVVRDSAGAFVVAESADQKITRAWGTGITELVAGSSAPGSVDGPGSLARFNAPGGIAVGKDGVAYVADTWNHQIRKVAPDGAVSTLAGTPGGGNSDGDGLAAGFWRPEGIAVDDAGNVFVADTGNSRVRRVTPTGTVSTLPVSRGVWGPSGIAVGGGGVLYVSDSRLKCIVKVEVDGTYSTLAGPHFDGGEFGDPRGITVSADGAVFVADRGYDAIRRVSPAGEVTTLAGAGYPCGAGDQDGTGSAASFDDPYGIAVDGGGTLYVADSANHKIRRVTVAGEVTTVAGSGSPGSLDGTGTEAAFYLPRGIAFHGGALYVADTGNGTIRVSHAGLADAATIDAPAGRVGEVRRLGTSPATATSWAWRVGRFPPGSAAVLSSASAAAPTFVPDVPGAYSFHLTASDGAATGDSTVTLDAAGPAGASVYGGGIACPGEQVPVFAALAGTPPWSLTWSDGVAQTGLMAQPALRMVVASSPALFTVTSVQDALSAASAEGGAQVTLAEAPAAVVATNDGPACEGGPLWLSTPAVRGATYSWSGTGGFTSTQREPMIPYSTLAAAGTYSVTVTVCGTSAPPAWTAVDVKPRPVTPEIVAPAWVQPSSSGWVATVPDHPGSTYFWAIDLGTIESGQGRNRIVFRSTTSAYVHLQVTETDANGCRSASSEAFVTVKDTASSYFTLPPCRLIDTRNASGWDPLTSSLAAGETRFVSIGGMCGVPAGARALAVNVTVTGAAAAGALTLYPSDLPAPPIAETIRFDAGQTRASAAILKLAELSWTFKVRNASPGPVHFVLDVSGYFR